MTKRKLGYLLNQKIRIISIEWVQMSKIIQQIVLYILTTEAYNLKLLQVRTIEKKYMKEIS